MIPQDHHLESQLLQNDPSRLPWSLNSYYTMPLYHLRTSTPTTLGCATPTIMRSYKIDFSQSLSLEVLNTKHNNKIVIFLTTETSHKNL